jgi:Tol biopolymer transport system component
MNIDVSRVWRDQHDGKVEAVPTASRSISPSISGEGRLVAFQAAAEDGHQDVFVYDRDTRETNCLSAPLRAVAPAMECAAPQVSGDGRSVVFEAWLGDGSASQIVRWRDGRHELLSANTLGEPSNGHARGPALSADGNVVAFESGASNLAPTMSFRTNIFVRDGASLECITAQANGDSSDVALSADGRVVAFTSGASNLVAGDTNMQYDIFVHDCKTGQTERVSVASDGTQANGTSMQPALSADGRFVAFVSAANNLGADGDEARNYAVYVHDRTTHETRRVSAVGTDEQAIEPTISADGRYAAYASGRSATQPGQVERLARIHVHDLRTDAKGVVDQAPACSPAMSADGMYLAFGSVKTTQGVYVVRNTVSEELRKKVLEQAVADALERSQQPAPQVIRADDYIEVGGVRVPRRA